MSYSMESRPPPYHGQHQRSPQKSSGIFAGFFLGMIVSSITIWYLTNHNPPSAKGRSITARGTLSQREHTVINIFKKASPSVTFITKVQYVRGNTFFDFDVLRKRKGTGSGFVWDRKGHIVTNYHVIHGANAIRVRLADQSSWPARLVGYARDKDLAVLRIRAPRSKLTPISVGRSHNLKVGQTVLAIGNPFGLDRTLTVGILSALNRTIRSLSNRPIRGVVQTDAAINPGNSGGPLLDSAGRLIGINTAIYSPSRANAGIGFAVPVDTVNRVVPQLIRYGKVRRPRIGIRPFQHQQFMTSIGKKGVMIEQVIPGSPAARVGLRGMRSTEFGDIILGDIIVKINGLPILSIDNLLTALEKRKVGDRIRIKVNRNDRILSFQLKLY